MEENDLITSMKKLLAFAAETNPIWPFAAMVLDQDGNELVRCTDCAHISPLYHAESLAIHVMCTKLGIRNVNGLTMITTCEPDPLSMSSIYWTRVVQDIEISKVAYGISLEQVSDLWPFGIDIHSREIIERSSNRSIQLHGSILIDEVLELFRKAKNKQLEMDKQHPALGQLSNDVDDFYTVS